MSNYYPVPYFIIMKNKYVNKNQSDPIQDLYINKNGELIISEYSTDGHEFKLICNSYNKLKYLACSMIHSLDPNDMTDEAINTLLLPIVEELHSSYPNLTKLQVLKMDSYTYVPEINRCVWYEDVIHLSPYVNSDSLITWLNNRKITISEFITNPKYIIFVENANGETSMVKKLFYNNIININNIQNKKEIFERLHDLWG